MATATLPHVNGISQPKPELTSEIYGGEIYEYYPLGKYVVAAPGVCGGRPTFKYTRLEVSMILALLANGETITELIQDYSLSNLHFEAVSEAILLASRVLVESANSVALTLAAKTLTFPINGVSHPRIELASELYGGELYEYYPLGKHIVAAPGVCGGRPTFKYTRLEASMILALLSNGETIDKIVAGYWRSKLTLEAALETITLARNAFVQSMQLHRLEAA